MSGLKTRGIGANCAQYLAKQSFHIIINYASNDAAAESAAQAIEKTGGSCELLKFDVTDSKLAEIALEKYSEKESALDALIINAGIHADTPLVTMLPEEWQKVLDINLVSFYNVVRPIVKGMVQKRQGKIVAVSSLTGQAGMAGQVNYAASKAGLIGAVKALAKELARRKITVNAVAPGFIETEMLDNLDREKLVRQIPMGRIGKPDDVPHAVNFLLSSNADYITGQILGINGGMLM